MDYASHALLPSLGLSRSDIFRRVPAGRSFRSVAAKKIESQELPELCKKAQRARRVCTWIVAGLYPAVRAVSLR